MKSVTCLLNAIGGRFTDLQYCTIIAPCLPSRKTQLATRRKHTGRRTVQNKKNVSRESLLPRPQHSPDKLHGATTQRLVYDSSTYNITFSHALPHRDVVQRTSPPNAIPKPYHAIKTPGIHLSILPTGQPKTDDLYVHKIT